MASGVLMPRLLSNWAWRYAIPACWYFEYWDLVKGLYIVQDVDGDKSTCLSFISRVVIVQRLRYPAGDLVCSGESIRVLAPAVRLLPLCASACRRIGKMVRQNVLQMLVNAGPSRFEAPEKRSRTSHALDQLVRSLPPVAAAF